MILINKFNKGISYYNWIWKLNIKINQNFITKDDKNNDKDNEDKKEFNWMFILLFYF